MLTTAFSVGWPDAAPCPAVSCRAAEAFDGDVVGHLIVDGQRSPIARFAVSTPSREAEGNIAAMALYAGEGVGDVHEVCPAAALAGELVARLG